MRKDSSVYVDFNWPHPRHGTGIYMGRDIKFDDAMRKRLKTDITADREKRVPKIWTWIAFGICSNVDPMLMRRIFWERCVFG